MDKTYGFTKKYLAKSAETVYNLRRNKQRRNIMKLNYKRTVMVGFAFFLICSFWQAYDNTIPLILTNKFGISQTWSGVIMALDNVLALFLLAGAPGCMAQRLVWSARGTMIFLPSGSSF